MSELMKPLTAMRMVEAMMHRSVYDDSEERVGNTAWCSCGMCSAMPTAAECLCCQEVDELAWKLQDLLWITQHENFTAVCLNEDVLRTAVSMIDLRRDSITEPLSCRIVVQTCVRVLD